jgi:hypothetical protein
MNALVLDDLLWELSTGYFDAWIHDMLVFYGRKNSLDCDYWDLFGAWVGGGPL